MKLNQGVGRGLDPKGERIFGESLDDAKARLKKSVPVFEELSQRDKAKRRTPKKT